MVRRLLLTYGYGGCPVEDGEEAPAYLRIWRRPAEDDEEAPAYLRLWRRPAEDGEEAPAYLRLWRPTCRGW
jgi:hypothetical protein